jgi:polysaccharide pyruvyl transferase WcaK-like protein
VLQRLPRFVRHRIARVVLGQSLRRTLPYWEAEFSTADAAVLGGGNLLADADLNFPLKVAAVLGAVAAAKLPAGVHGVGVSDNWSRDGEILFRDALAGVHLRHAAVRDEVSREIWIRRLGPAGIMAPCLARDPGLLAAECYPAPDRTARPVMRVGICVTHPVALRYHADEAMPDARELTRWLAALVGELTRMGRATFLFTTGSPEDEAYLDRVMPGLLAAVDPAGTATRIPRFAGAGEMARFVATLDLLLAHRLHACVAAYAYGVPHIGFTWDNKMKSFFESVDRSRFLRGAVATSAAEIAELAHEAIRVGIDTAARKAVAAETHGDIARLIRDLAIAPG